MNKPLNRNKCTRHSTPLATTTWERRWKQATDTCVVVTKVVSHRSHNPQQARTAPWAPPPRECHPLNAHPRSSILLIQWSFSNHSNLTTRGKYRSWPLSWGPRLSHLLITLPMTQILLGFSTAGSKFVSDCMPGLARLRKWGHKDLFWFGPLESNTLRPVCVSVLFVLICGRGYKWTREGARSCETWVPLGLHRPSSQPSLTSGSSLLEDLPTYQWAQPT
jgi:hypothetical protein